jgi:glutamate N-acetyltransferase/amino-acid N-acetyltransferase
MNTVCAFTPPLAGEHMDSLTTTQIAGFRVAGLEVGLRAHFGKDARPDMALIVSDRPCSAAGVFTTNLVKAAPVLLGMERLAAAPEGIRAVLVNTASANACTGQQGLANARRSAELTEAALGLAAGSALVMSTGVIGTHLPMAVMERGIAQAAVALSETDWQAAAAAIMTTDTRPKLRAYSEDGLNIVGIAKGAGMIAPNMATMLSVIVTDAALPVAVLREALQAAVEVSFNRVVVDGDMSTNDTVLLLANGAGARRFDAESVKYFQPALDAVCTALARAVVSDGEGVTKLINLYVTGAADAASARQIGNAIATSPLVKTAFYGGDPNWGRILAAAGRAGVSLAPERLSLWYNDLQLVAEGTPLDYDEGKAKLLATQPEIDVRLDLGAGEAEAVVWTCDLSHDYVSINGHYRT